MFYIYMQLNLRSYDYGAPIREDRTLTSKFSEIKLQANFLHASPDFLVAKRFGRGLRYSSDPRIYTTALRAPSGAHFYIIRQNRVGCVSSFACFVVLKVDGPILATMRQ